MVPQFLIGLTDKNTMVTIDGQEYEILQMMIRPCFVYEEGDKEEDLWVDDQNAEYYYMQEEDENGELGIMKDGRKHWIISPYKPKGIKITEENEDLVKDVVWFGPKDDVGKEWDFDNHCVKQ